MTQSKKFRVLVGLNWPGLNPGDDERRAEPGDVVDDLPTAAIPGLLESGAIEKAGPAKAKGGES